MEPTLSRPLATPEEIAMRAGEQVPYVRLPDRQSVFADRETRLRQRSASHPMREFLLFVAEVAREQDAALQAYPGVVLPDAAALASAASAGMPPLPATNWRRDPVWRDELRRLLDHLLPRLRRAGLAPAAITACEDLRVLDDARLEQQADRLLNGVMVGLDLAVAPLIAAGLQMYWTQMVLSTQAAHATDRLAPFGRTDDVTLCPCCGSRPTASVSRIDAAANGYRYLHCALCSTQWHMVRIKCTHCLATKGISYQSLQRLSVSSGEAGTAGGAKDAVQAEACDTCGHYLKIVHMERDMHVEPVADDLASLPLDLLVAEAGLQRHGVNLMLLFGDPDEAAPEPRATPAAGIDPRGA